MGAQSVSIIVTGNLIEPELPFTIEAIERDATTGDVDITWPAIVGDRYQVESSPDLKTGNWTLRGGEISATKEEITFTLDEPPSIQQKFYRVRRN